MTARTLALLLLLPLVACSTPEGVPQAPEMSTIDPEPPVDISPEASGDVVRDAQLTNDQGDDLRSLGVPVLLPTLGEEWTAEGLETITEYGASYDIAWRRTDGACLWMSGSNDGLGGPEYPVLSATTAIPGLPGEPQYRVYKAADDPASTSASNWGVGTVVTDYVETGMMWHWFISSNDDGCQPLALEEAASLLASLRPLAPLAHSSGSTYSGQDPVWEDPELGVFLFDDGVTGDAMQGDPVDAVRAWMQNPELDDPEIRVLSSSPEEIRILATRTNLEDDSVRDQRSLFVFRSRDGRIQFFASGVQVRCWPNRGHQDWSAEYCL